MNKLAIFDCDGTLVDSGATIYQALAEAFAIHALDLPSPRDCRRVIGLSVTEAMAALLPQAEPREHLQLAETYKSCFIKARIEGRVQEPLFDGVLDLLDTLEGEGWLLAVATGKSDRGLRHCLASHGLHARFVSLQTADRHPSKPDRAMAVAAIAESGAVPETTIVVGDTAFDMGMASSAGAAGIGAAWGYHEADELVAAGAIGVAHVPGEVLRLANAALERVRG